MSKPVPDLNLDGWTRDPDDYEPEREYPEDIAAARLVHDDAAYRAVIEIRGASFHRTAGWIVMLWGPSQPYGPRRYIDQDVAETAEGLRSAVEKLAARAERKKEAQT